MRGVLRRNIPPVKVRGVLRRNTLPVKVRGVLRRNTLPVKEFLCVNLPIDWTEW